MGIRRKLEIGRVVGRGDPVVRKWSRHVLIDSLASWAHDRIVFGHHVGLETAAVHIFSILAMLLFLQLSDHAYGISQLGIFVLQSEKPQQIDQKRTSTKKKKKLKRNEKEKKQNKKKIGRCFFFVLLPGYCARN
jgi:hypothetical protein